MDDNLQQDIDSARAMSKSDLIRWTMSWKESSARRLVGDLELARRQKLASEIRAWIAIVVSIGSLLLSIVALATKK